MFTGLVEGCATVEAASLKDGVLALALALPFETALGDSVAVDGCCLTVASLDGATATFAAVSETLAATQLGDRRPGDRVHVERALRLGDRLGGHLVTGHVDATGTIRARQDAGGALRITFDLSPTLLRYIVRKGSVTVDGVSLTVQEVVVGGCRVDLVPHTVAVTGFGGYAVGRRVNVEVDLMARYAEGLLAPREGS